MYWISHQNAFHYDAPKEGRNWIEHSVIQHFAPTEHAIGLYWYHFEQQSNVAALEALGLAQTVSFWMRLRCVNGSMNNRLKWSLIQTSPVRLLGGF